MRTAGRSTAGARRGFTLVELLIVMTIMAVLMGILLPAIGSAMRHAEYLQCKNNLKQIATAVISYTTDYRGAIPPTRYTRSGLSWANLLAQRYLPAQNAVELEEKIRSTQNTVLMCPSTEDVLVKEADQFRFPDDTKAQGWFRTGTDQDPHKIKTDCSYYWNGYTGTDSTKKARYPSLEVNEEATNVSDLFHDISEINNRTTMAMVMDGVFWDGDSLPQRIAARHPGEYGNYCVTNIAFYDTHVDSMDRYAPGRYPNRDWSKEEVTENSPDMVPIMNKTARPLGLEGGPPYFMLPKR